MWVEGDDWNHTNPLIEGDDLDEQYFNTRLRYDRPDNLIPSLPVKIEITGRVVHVTPTFGSRKVRARITTWDSNEEPVSFGGWLWIS
jgi:hypothetical protein